MTDPPGPMAIAGLVDHNPSSRPEQDISPPFVVQQQPPAPPFTHHHHHHHHHSTAAAASSPSNDNEPVSRAEDALRIAKKNASHDTSRFRVLHDPNNQSIYGQARKYASSYAADTRDSSYESGQIGPFSARSSPQPTHDSDDRALSLQGIAAAESLAFTSQTVPMDISSQSVSGDISPVLESVAKFPSDCLGTIIYRPFSNKDGRSLLPIYPDKLNCTLTIRIPFRYLNPQYNDSLKHRAFWGTDIYTDDSDLVCALYHTGHVQNHTKEDCIITIRLLPTLTHYAESLRHGIRSRPWNTVPHDGISYTIENVRFMPPGTAEMSGNTGRKQRLEELAQLRNHLSQGESHFHWSRDAASKAHRTGNDPNPQTTVPEEKN